jgi:hypothetical protein
MDDSLVLMFHGGAGGGKTMSAVVQCIIDMVCYKQIVYSMVPIRFNFKEYDDSEPVHYESKFLDLNLLLRQDKIFKNSIVLWDEINLWLFSRSHAAVINKLYSQLITLRRKLNMSLYATTQFLSLVDKNIRMQSDSDILCFDLHYSYPNLSKGQVINQSMTDVSGKFTGRPHEMTGMVYERMLHGDPFKGTYPTDHTFDIYEASRKYRVKQDYVNEISFGDVDGALEPYDAPDLVKNKAKELLDSLEGKRWYTSDIQAYLNDNGVEGSPKKIGWMMKKAGYTRKQIAGGEYVYLKEDGVKV